MPAIAQPRFFLSTIPAEPKDRRQALFAGAVFALVFLSCAPFARVQLPEVWAFIPIYESALIVSDLITALLLFAQFGILRGPSLLLIAAGYLFTAVMAAVHMASFPGLFSPTGLLGAGAQTTAWLFMAWHAGFPFAVIGYAFAKRKERADRSRAPLPAAALPVAILAVLVLAGGFTLAATAGHGWLPPIMQGNHYTPAMAGTVTSVWGLSFVALLVLISSRPQTVFDLWLAAVMVAWMADIGLAAVLNQGRFDLGFYVGRIFGLLAANFILIVLLLETGTFYVRIAEERERRLQQVQDELIHVARLNELGQMVSGLAHELNQPLTAATNYLGAAHHLAESTKAGAIDQIVQKAADQIARAEQIIDRLRRLARRSEIERRAENLASAVEEVVSLLGSQAATRGTSIEQRIDPSATVLIDRVQVQQVLLNLTRNAIEAMANGPRRELRLASNAAEPGFIELAVADTGPGLEPSVRETLFQPFVSTKATGMGVGLSICRSIIESHGGRIWTTDNPGGGTVFHFTLQSA